MGRPNDETLADLNSDLEAVPNEPQVEVKEHSKFFHPATPQFILDEHEALLKLDPEYKKLVDVMEELFEPYQEMSFKMEETSHRLTEILNKRLQKTNPFTKDVEIVN